jgi:hypothetical protein
MMKRIVRNFALHILCLVLVLETAGRSSGNGLLLVAARDEDDTAGRSRGASSVRDERSLLLRSNPFSSHQSESQSQVSPSMGTSRKAFHTTDAMENNERSKKVRSYEKCFVFSFSGTVMRC